MKFVRPVLVRLLLLLQVAALPSMAVAAPKVDCFGFDALDDDPLAVQLYEVGPGENVMFGCPEKSLLCRRGAFLVPGDQVVVSRVVGDRACADYLSPTAKTGSEGTAGWLPLTRLAAIAPAPDWVGRWRGGETTIVATARGDRIRIDAKAELQFGHGTEYGQFAALIDGERSQARFGYEAGDGERNEKLLDYQDKAPAGLCQVKMRQLGRYLVVGDNRMCGGMNVSFSGVYGRVADGGTAARPVASKPATARSAPAGLRPSFQACLHKSGGVTSEMQDCIGAEYRYQDDRLNKIYRVLRQKLAEAEATGLRDEQRRWIAERDKACAPDPDGGTAAALGSNDCELEQTAKRADELEGRLSR